MAFELPPLPYDYAALEPTIDEATMKLHHGKHHQAYTDKLNEAVAADPALEGKSIGAILADMASQPKKVRDNGGGYWNHDFFWTAMKPKSDDAAGDSPSGALAQAIDAKFGSLADMKTKFGEAGVAQFGSGWVWLIVDKQGELAITSTPNQDNPMMGDAGTPGTPILGNDVWEHAYYLTYNNRRPDYLKAWWHVVDWDKAAARYEAATA